MQRIRVFESHEHYQKQDPDATENFIILGVHGFLTCLLQMGKCQRIRIFLEGNPDFWIQKVLWNQFYAATLLKDCHKLLSFDGKSSQIFLKINGRTYRLSELLNYAKSTELTFSLQKCLQFSLQGFECNGTVKVIEFEMGTFRGGQFDIYFVHTPTPTPQLSTAKKRSTLSKQKSKNVLLESTSKNRENSIQNKASLNDTKKKTSNSNKENGQGQGGWIQKNLWGIRTENIATEKGEKSKKRSHSGYCSIARKSDFPKSKDKKQEIIGSILKEKENKLRDIKSENERQEKCYQDQIQDLIQSHTQEVSRVKIEVEDLLTSYQIKNKSLKKENTCLQDLNSQLTFSLTNREKENQELHQMVQNLSIKLSEKNSECKDLEFQLKEKENDGARWREEVVRLERELKENKEGAESRLEGMRKKYESVLVKVKRMGWEMNSLGLQQV